jgi:hypothetical protein
MMAAVLCALMTYAGLAALSLAMHRHQNEVFGKALRAGPSRMFRYAGVLLLAVSIIPCVHAWGGPIGLVGWFGIMTASATVLVLLLQFAPRPALYLCWLAPAAALALALSSALP